MSRPPDDGGTTSYVEVVDPGAGSLRAGGHLTEQGADLLYGAVRAMQGRGHDRVTVDLAGMQAADAAGLHALRLLLEDLSTDGRELVVLHAPAAAGAR